MTETILYRNTIEVNGGDLRDGIRGNGQRAAQGGGWLPFVYSVETHLCWVALRQGHIMGVYLAGAGTLISNSIRALPSLYVGSTRQGQFIFNFRLFDYVDISGFVCSAIIFSLFRFLSQLVRAKSSYIIQLSGGAVFVIFQ